MKILHTPVRIYTTGGVESYVLHLCRELAKRGHKTTVVCADTRGPEKVPQEISVRALSPIFKIANTEVTPKIPLVLAKEEYDIIHTHLPTPWSADWSSVVSKIRRKPLVLTYHNDITGQGVAGHIAYLYNKTFLKVLLKRADKVIVARPDNYFRNLKGVEDKTEVIPVGIDETRFYPKPARPIADIFFLSVLDRFHGYKGLDILLQAIKQVIKTNPNVSLVVGGSGPMSEEYAKMARDLGIGKNVVFAGFIPKDEIMNYYNGCKAFVLPSTDATLEGFGIVLLEAMACKKPVICTNIAGTARDIRSRRAGIVVSPKNVDELAEAIVEVIGDEDKANRMGLAGRTLVEEKYSWAKVAASVERVYEELL